MKIIELLEPNFTFADDRGILTQLVREGYRQINVVTSAPGVRRGGHYHKQNTEIFFVVEGEVEVTASLGSETDVRTFGEGDMFAIRPNVVHGFLYLKKSILVALYDLGVEGVDGTKDIFPA